MTKGDRIRELREAKGLTQEELAKLLNTKRQTISKYEKGIVTNIPSDRLEEIAEILDSSPEYILGWESVQKNNDALVDIVDRLMDDPSESKLFERILNDSEFHSLVKILCELDAKQIAGFKQMLEGFKTF